MVAATSQLSELATLLLHFEVKSAQHGAPVLHLGRPSPRRKLDEAQSCVVGLQQKGHELTERQIYTALDAPNHRFTLPARGWTSVPLSWCNSDWLVTRMGHRRQCAAGRGRSHCRPNRHQSAAHISISTASSKQKALVKYLLYFAFMSTRETKR